jgi:hypothetical protein
MSTDQTITCGLFSWRPQCLQRFATPTSFMIVFSIFGIVSSAIFAYLTVVLSTIEKRFGLKVERREICAQKQFVFYLFEQTAGKK